MAARATCPKVGGNYATNTFWTEQRIELSQKNKGCLDIVDNTVFLTLAMFGCVDTPCDELLVSMEENIRMLVKFIRTSMLDCHCSTLYQSCMSSFMFAEAWLQQNRTFSVCVCACACARTHAHVREREREFTQPLQTRCYCYSHFINEKVEAQNNKSDLVQTGVSVKLSSEAFTFRF